MLDQISVFYRGLVLGLMIAAPVGPVGLLCIRRTIQKGLPNGFATGLGAALADAIFGAVAALGVAAIMKFIEHYNVYIRMLGGVFLLLAAWHTWRDRPKSSSQSALVQRFVGLAKDASPMGTFMGTLRAFVSGLAITLTNPITLFATLAVVATFGDLKKHADAMTLVAGLFSGSTLWWIVLSGGVALVRGHFTEHGVILINRVTAVVLTGLAFWAVSSGLQGYLLNP